jgi:hypothetical protein
MIRDASGHRRGNPGCAMNAAEGVMGDMQPVVAARSVGFLENPTDSRAAARQSLRSLRKFRA